MHAVVEDSRCEAESLRPIIFEYNGFKLSNFMCIESYINLAVNLGAFYVLLTVCHCYILNNILKRILKRISYF